VRVNAEWLLAEMVARGWSQTDLAKEAGVSQTVVSSALRGENISARSVKAIRGAIDRIPQLPGMGDLVASA
jgi:transcriptional regulator with XRE-family HTH domain